MYVCMGTMSIYLFFDYTDDEKPAAGYFFFKTQRESFMRDAATQIILFGKMRPASAS